MKLTERFFGILRWASFAAVLVMMSISLADIVIRNARKWLGAFTGIDVPVAIPGVVDMVVALVVVTAFLAVPVVYFDDEHVGVDIVLDALSRRARLVMKALAALLSGLFMLVCTITAWGQLELQYSAGYTTPSIGIPVWWFWVLIVFGCATSVLACGTLFVRQVLRLRQES